jgi:hypothetical protein
MTAATFGAADVPALRRDLIDWLADGRGLGFHSVMSHTAGTMIGRPDLDGSPTMMRVYAEMVVHQERRALRDAELYYVTPEMTGLIRAAAASMPPFVPGAADFPTRSGLIVFGAPLIEVRRPEDAVGLVVEGRLVADFRDRPYQDTGIVAATWSPYDAGGSWSSGGIWMSFYTTRDNMLAPLLDDRIRTGIQRGLTRLVPDNEFALAYGSSNVAEELREHDHPDYTSNWMKYLMTTLLLMQQPLVYQRTQPTLRGLRRQLQRKGYPVGDIRILDARPRRYTTVAGPARPAPEHAAGEDAADDAPDGRKIGVRFPVRGFWRNQWYPSRQLHRPLWIDPHWRGPEDAPITGADRVRVLRTHPSETAHV